MSDHATLTLTVEKSKLAALDALAGLTARDRGELVAEAIDHLIMREAAEIEKIGQAVRQADAGGPFVSHEDALSFIDALARGEKPPLPKAHNRDWR